MKKILAFLMMLVVVLSIFSGCNIGAIINNIKDAATENTELKAQADTIIECFKTGDIDTLEAMFCEESRATNDLPSQIQEAFNCIDGEILSYEYLNFGMTGGTNSNNEFTTKDYDIQVTVTTNKGEKYEIKYNRFFVYNNKPERIGIIDMNIWETGWESIENKTGYYENSIFKIGGGFDWT